MLELIIVILFINSLLSLFQTQYPSLLYCGLFGFLPKNNGKVNITFLQLIASYNTIRGTDNCGFFINNKIIKGVNNEADVRVFMARNKLEVPKNAKNHLVMGHTRKSTYGDHNVNSAHPFEIVSKNSTMIIQHNGTISNIGQLATEYGFEFQHHMVDSYMLGKILHKKQGDFSVLEKYEGGAALMWTYKNEPNVLYVFKGASKEKHRGNAMIEERPLFHIHLDEGTYFSSLREPLDAIINGRKNIKVMTITPNVVYQVKNGKFIELAKIDRSNINTYVPMSYSSNHSNNNCDIKSMVLSDVYSENMSWYLKQLENEECVCYVAGRYYDFRTLPRDVRNSITYLWEIPNHEHYLLHGKYMLQPYTFSASVFNSNSSLFSKEVYFHKGVLISNNCLPKYIDKKMEKRLEQITNTSEYLKQLSAYSNNPVFPLYKDRDDKFCIYHKGNIIKTQEIIKPLYTPRYYSFQTNSNLMRFGSEAEADKKYIQKFTTVHSSDNDNKNDNKNSYRILHKSFLFELICYDTTEDNRKTSEFIESIDGFDNNIIYILKTDDYELPIDGSLLQEELKNFLFEKYLDYLLLTRTEQEKSDMSPEMFLDHVRELLMDNNQNIVGFFHIWFAIDIQSDIREFIEEYLTEYVNELEFDTDYIDSEIGNEQFSSSDNEYRKYMLNRYECY